MKKTLYTLALIVSFSSFGQNYVTFNDNKTILISDLSREFINIFGTTNFYSINKSTSIKFERCFFSKIAKSSTYKKYKIDIQNAINHSSNQDKRLYFFYSINYIKSALWHCIEDVPELVQEMSRTDKIIPQSEEKIKAIAIEILKDFKKELGIEQYNELGRNLDWKTFSECYVRKLWKTFSPREMMNATNEINLKTEQLMQNCMVENLRNN